MKERPFWSSRLADSLAVAFQREASHGFRLFSKVPDNRTRAALSLLQNDTDAVRLRESEFLLSTRCGFGIRPVDGVAEFSELLREYIRKNFWAYGMGSASLAALRGEVRRHKLAEGSRSVLYLQSIGVTLAEIENASMGLVPYTKKRLRDLSDFYFMQKMGAGRIAAMDDLAYAYRWQFDGGLVISLEVSREEKGYALGYRLNIFEANKRIFEFCLLRELRIGGPQWDLVHDSTLGSALEILSELVGLSLDILYYAFTK